MSSGISTIRFGDFIAPQYSVSNTIPPYESPRIARASDNSSDTPQWVLFQSFLCGKNIAAGFSDEIILAISSAALRHASAPRDLGFMLSKPSPSAHIFKSQESLLQHSASSARLPGLRALFEPSVTATSVTLNPHSLIMRIAKPPDIDSSSGCGANIKTFFCDLRYLGAQVCAKTVESALNVSPKAFPASHGAPSGISAARDISFFSSSAYSR